MKTRDTHIKLGGGQVCMAQRQEFLFEPDLAAIAYEDFARALERLPYASVVRVGLQLLAVTGCRITELDNMDPANLLGNELFWRPGKNQKGLRREIIPDGLLTELAAYRRSERTRGGFLLGISSQTFVRYFDRDARPLIGGAWTARCRQYQNGRGWTDGWTLHLKGFRKTFQTILFHYFHEKYDDSGVALEWVSKRMKHSSKHITAYHYLQDHTRISTDRWVQYLRTGTSPRQRRIHDYT